MAAIAFNVVLSSALISAAVWLSRTSPQLGGFVISLPLSTLIALVLARVQGDRPEQAFDLAKSIFVALPATLVFFVPFLVAGRLKLGFWTCYITGIALLGVAFFAHRRIMET